MTHHRILQIQDEKNEGCKLQVFLNSDNRIFIETGNLKGDDPYYNGYLTMSKEDAIELIKELQQLVKSME